MSRDEAEVSAYIGSDNYEGGVIAATYVGEVLNGSGKVAILEGIPGHETADSRQRGFLDGISKFEGVTVVTSRSEEHTSELQSRGHLVCRLLLDKNKDR